MTVYQIKDWNRHFESDRSRGVRQCSHVYMPNKQDGLGYGRIVAETDGPAIYGVWTMICSMLSRQQKPRNGWLTDTGAPPDGYPVLEFVSDKVLERPNTNPGRPLSLDDIAFKLRRPIEEVRRTVEFVVNGRVGWVLEINLENKPAEPLAPPVTITPPAPAPVAPPEELPLESAPVTPPQPETTKRSYKRSTTRELAKGVLAHLNTAAGRQFRETIETLDLIACRLEEVGLDTAGVEKMIDRQIARWKGDEKMEEYLRPATLFGKTKFSGYYDMRDMPVAAKGGRKDEDYEKKF